MLAPVSRAWLWGNKFSTDVHLQLRCSALHGMTDAPISNDRGSKREASVYVSPARSKAARHDAASADLGAGLAARLGAPSCHLAPAEANPTPAALPTTAPSSTTCKPALALPPSVSASTGDGADVCKPLEGYTHHLHGWVIASHSAYFRSTLEQLTVGASPGPASSPSAIGALGGPGYVAGSGYWLVEQVQEGELAAAEAVLRHCYTGTLSCEAAGTDTPSIPMLLQMLVMAERWSLPKCASCCREALAMQQAADYDTTLAGASDSSSGEGSSCSVFRGSSC